MMPPAWAKDPGVIENEVVMHRQVHAGSFLIVEGPDDMRFWRRWITGSTLCELVVGCGKPNVEGAIVRLDSRGFLGALGVVDADFDLLQGRAFPSANLLATETHDLETLLLRSAALDGLLAEHGDTEKIRDFERTEGRSVRDALLARGLSFGRLRWLARRDDWPGSCESFRPSQRFVDEKTWQVDEATLLGAAVTAGLATSLQDLNGAITNLPLADPWSVCHGHDLVELLRLGLRSALGSPKRSLGCEDIASSLRLACERVHLERTDLYRAIRDWEQVNAPYRVLSPQAP